METQTNFRVPNRAASRNLIEACERTIRALNWSTTKDRMHEDEIVKLLEQALDELEPLRETTDVFTIAGAYFLEAYLTKDNHTRELVETVLPAVLANPRGYREAAAVLRETLFPEDNLADIIEVLAECDTVIPPVPSKSNN